MKTGNEKYDRIIEALRNSEPELAHQDTIEQRVIERISGIKENTGIGIFDLLFGWVYIGWVRKTLITTSFAIVGFFIWQQHSIMNQVDELRSEIRENRRITTYDPSSTIQKRKFLLEFSEKRTEKIAIPEEDLQMLVDSLDNLSTRYREILELIDADPELKKLVEEKLERKLPSVFKL